MTIVKIWPYSEEFTTGYRPYRKDPDGLPSGIKFRRRLKKPWYDPRTHESVELPAINQMALESRDQDALTTEHCVRLFNAYELAGDESKASAAVEAFERIQGRGLAPGLVSCSELSQKKSVPDRQGGKGITSTGKRMVRSGVAWLFQNNPRSRLTFATLTMPALSPEQALLYCQNFPDITKRMMEEVSRQLRRHGLPADYVLVVEVQPERFHAYGEVALHLHALWKGRSAQNMPWAISKDWLRRVWKRILENHVGGIVDTTTATRVEIPRNSNLTGEMGKYMSKGGDILKSVHGAGLSHLLPRRWWGMSVALKKLIKSNVQHIEGNAATEMDRSLSKFRQQGLLSFHRVIHETTDYETGEITRKDRGAIGRFSSALSRRQILERVKSLSRPGDESQNQHDFVQLSRMALNVSFVDQGFSVRDREDIYSVIRLGRRAA